MRHLIQKLGRPITVIIITVISILVSVFATFLGVSLRQDGANSSLSYAMAIIVPVFVAPPVSWPLVGVLMKIDSLEKEMRALATYDSLTQLLSRRAFFHDAKRLVDSAELKQTLFSVIALDLDEFKNINDSYGHAAGDEVLKQFAITTKTIMREGDLIGRIGGDEFVMLLSNTSEDTVHTLSERLHHAVRESIIKHDQVSIKYTVSMGLVSLLPKTVDTIESALKMADQSLYLAKEKGRNCTVVFNANKVN